MVKQIKDTNTDFMFNITAMNIGTQKLLGYTHCMIEHRKFAVQPTLIYDKSKLLENSYVMEWIPSLHQD